MQDPVSQIKELADIVELISEHIQVQRRGANHVALCPFHNDRKPSMYISRSKGIFKCFSCGAGGDVFKFWSEFHKKDFKETIKDLAQKYGVELNYQTDSKETTTHFNLQIKMHELAAKYYQSKLLGSSVAQHCREYLQRRNIGTQAIDEFKLGYSPGDSSNWSSLSKYLTEELSVSEEDLVNAGLAIRSEKTGKIYDRFRSRLMIPICDERDRVIAFGARALKDPETGLEAEPKYLNSPETSIYEKGNHLYGLNLAKNHIRKEDSVIVVEGYFDLISAHQAGIKNLVCNQGTALTPKQIKLLSKYTESKKIYLCFDTDRAGEEATEKAIERILPQSENFETEIRIIRVPSGKDPDELIRFSGPEAFRALISQAPLIINYEIDKVIKKIDGSPQSKSKAISELAKYLAHIKNQVELSEYFKLIAEKLKTDENATATELRKKIQLIRSVNSYENPYSPNPKLTYDRPRSNQKAESRNFSNKKLINGHLLYMNDPLYSSELELLVLALRDRKILEEFLSSESKLSLKPHTIILDSLIEISFENPELEDPDLKYSLLKDRMIAYPEYSSELADLGIALELEQQKSDIMIRYQDIIKKLRKLQLSEEMQSIISKIKALESSEGEDLETWNELQKNKQAILKSLQAI
jgi:DNA primase catalytic core